jgi:hypothetical protein
VTPTRRPGCVAPVVVAMVAALLSTHERGVEL